MNLQELLDRRYIQGTRVTNCVLHMDLPLTERPDMCLLCLSDLRNQLSLCVAVNKWLNEWKDDATKILEERHERMLICSKCGRSVSFFRDPYRLVRIDGYVRGESCEVLLPNGERCDGILELLEDK